MTCFLRSAISLKRLNAVFSAWPSSSKPISCERFAERVAAGVLAEHDRVAAQPDGGGVHDLVGGALLQHAVLVDAGLVRERVAPDDRLVRLHLVAGQSRDQPARARDLGRLDARPQTEARLARAQQHHDLLQRGVAGALADAVDRALDLAAARFQARERVGDRQSEVVVAVHRDGHVVQRRHQPVERFEHRAYSRGIV